MLRGGEHRIDQCRQVSWCRDELAGIVADLVAGCRDPETFHHVNLVGLPSQESVVRLWEGFRRVLFPGYFGDQEIDHFTLPYQMGMEVNRSLGSDRNREDKPVSVRRVYHTSATWKTKR